MPVAVSTVVRATGRCLARFGLQMAKPRFK
jgi:hypothetical protein